MKTEAEFNAELDRIESEMDEIRLKLRILKEFESMTQTQEKKGDEK